MLIRTQFFRFVTFITLFALLYTSTEGYVYAQEIQKDQLIKEQKAKEQKVRIEKQYGEIKKAVCWLPNVSGGKRVEKAEINWLRFQEPDSFAHSSE